MDRILDRVNIPADLKGLSLQELERLAGEVRSMIIETVSRTGGHLAANLGVVELTIAMLRIFDPPSDKIVWDVSHQTYAFKILTGRKDRFHTLRQMGGISGFLNINESEYDAFGAGHSGTALSAALGMAVARDKSGGDEHIVAVLGDGSFGCGISYEALNNIADTTKRFIVVLNDNEMSIAANVGAMSMYLGRLLSNPRYNRWKKSVESLATKLRMGFFRSIYYRIEEAIKSLFLKNIIFEELGLRYIGPIDGHNMPYLLDALTIAKNYDKPIVLHVSTQKGRGYSFSEEHPEKWHGTSPFDVETGELLAESKHKSYSSVFGETLERLAEKDKRIVAITAAMASGTGLSGFERKFPDRFFDVGISEEHATVFAAGLAAGGFTPVFAVYSTFSQRAVDCIIHDVCLQNLPVIFCFDRAGIVGDDGPTHHGMFDIALLRPIPNLVIMQPKDEAELTNMLFTATKIRRPVVIRYPRGSGPGAPVGEKFSEIELGKAEIILSIPAKGDNTFQISNIKSPIIQIWALGDMVQVALETAELLKRNGITPGVVNARFVRPLDEQLLNRHLEADMIVTLENGIVSGGFGAGVEEFAVSRGFRGRIIKIGWPDRFIPHGATDKLMKEFGLVPEKITETIIKCLRSV